LVWITLEDREPGEFALVALSVECVEAQPAADAGRDRKLG
jgi:hypothetical protein